MRRFPWTSSGGGQTSLRRLRLPRLGRLVDPELKFVYRFFENPAQISDAYLALLKDELVPLIEQGLAAAVYTQLADVEIELNGYLTCDRGRPKMDDEARVTAQELSASGAGFAPTNIDPSARRRQPAASLAGASLASGTSTRATL
jgi:hypothetical protein